MQQRHRFHDASGAVLDVVQVAEFLA